MWQKSPKKNTALLDLKRPNNKKAIWDASGLLTNLIYNNAPVCIFLCEIDFPNDYKNV